MNDIRDDAGRFAARDPLALQLTRLGAPPEFARIAERLEAGGFAMPGYVRAAAGRALVGFCRASREAGLPVAFEPPQIRACLDALDEAGGGQTRRNETLALEAITRQLGHPFAIVDGWECRLRR